MIDATAIIHPEAEISADVSIGPYSVIGAHVFIDSGTTIGSHVVINGPTRIGSNNRIYQFCSIGEDPQDKKFHGESASTLEIGSGNTFREYVSINRGTGDGGGKTVIGENSIIGGNAWVTESVPPNSTVFHTPEIKIKTAPSNA